jgi:putative endonuclease
MFFIYILHSSSADKYYVGYTSNIQIRLQQHNTQEDFNTFTKKFRPWILTALFSCGEEESKAMRIEKYIKKQKSRRLIEILCDDKFTPNASLAQLVRVPHVRD